MISYEVASWLNNADGLGCTDEQFAETFGLLQLMMNGRNISDTYDQDRVIKALEPKELCNRLQQILTEIQNNYVNK